MPKIDNYTASRSLTLKWDKSLRIYYRATLMVCEVGIHPYVMVRTKKRLQSFGRYVVERTLKIKLDKHVEVHHINGDSLDNRFENLMVCTKRMHTTLHLLIEDGVPQPVVDAQIEMLRLQMMKEAELWKNKNQKKSR